MVKKHDWMIYENLLTQTIQDSAISFTGENSEIFKVTLASSTINHHVSSTCNKGFFYMLFLFVLYLNDYTDESARLIHKWVNNNHSQEVTIKMMVVLPFLLIQKCSQTSKWRDHTKCFKQCLQLCERRYYCYYYYYYYYYCYYHYYYFCFIKNEKRFTLSHIL